VRRGRELGAIRGFVRQRAASDLIDGSQPLPDVRNFAAEFIEYCAGRGCAPRAFAKVSAFRAKLLAMQRASL
jgi:hypothetical protein